MRYLKSMCLSAEQLSKLWTDCNECLNLMTVHKI